MKIKEGLTVREALTYAKDNGYDSTAFKLNINDNYVISGKFIDAYYEMINLPFIGTGFTRFKELCEQYGERNISIDIVDEEEFKTGVEFDFIIHGKFDLMPKKYQVNSNSDKMHNWLNGGNSEEVFMNE